MQTPGVDHSGQNHRHRGDEESTHWATFRERNEPSARRSPLSGVDPFQQQALMMADFSVVAEQHAFGFGSHYRPREVRAGKPLDRFDGDPSRKRANLMRGVKC